MNSNFKIMFLVRSLNIGGAERQMVYLAKGLQESGADVSVTVFYGNGTLEKELHEVGIPVINLNKSGRWDLISFIKRLFTAVNRVNPHVIYGFLGTPNILTILVKPLFRNIRMVWGVRASNVDLNRYDWLSRVSYRIECRLAKFADLIICNSHAGLDYAIHNGFPISKTMVIPNGIDIERFCPDAEAGKRIRRIWGISDNEILIGLVGRLDPMKDHPTFIKAASVLTRENKDVCFVCVGDGPEPYKTELKYLSLKLGLGGRILWPGACYDMPSVYNALDIAVSSSSFGEGFPNVLGEAMACGTYCVVTDVGDSAKVVGNTGIVVPSNSPDILAEGWRTILARTGDEKAILARQARQRIVDNFSIDSLISKTSDVLTDLI